MAFRLLFIMSALPVMLCAATVRLHVFENPSNDTSVTAMALKINEFLALGLREKGILVEPVTETVPAAHSTDELSMIWGRIVKEDTAIRIEAFIETGLSPTVIEKNVLFNGSETMEQNAEPILRRFGFVLEERYSAMLSVASTPPACSLVLDGRERGVTPAEFLCPAGNHDLVLTMAGYDPFRERIRVAPGNNRYTFNLKREERPGDLWRQWYAYTFIGGWMAFAASFYFHSAYRSEYGAYQAVRSKGQAEYDRYYNAAQNNLYSRNACFSLSFGLFAVSVYKLKGRLFQ